MSESVSKVVHFMLVVLLVASIRSLLQEIYQSQLDRKCLQRLWTLFLLGLTYGFALRMGKVFHASPCFVQVAYVHFVDSVRLIVCCVAVTSDAGKTPAIPSFCIFPPRKH
jgi:uncharacterized membrane protein YoaK (UPF0700 family)